MDHPESHPDLRDDAETLMAWARESIRLSGASPADVAAAIGSSVVIVNQLLRDNDPSVLTRPKLYALGGMSMRTVPARVLRALRRVHRAQRANKDRGRHQDRRRLTALQFLEDDAFDIHAQDARAELEAVINVVVNTWAPEDRERNRAILRDRFGVETGTFASLQAAANPHGLTRERVRQIERRLLRHAKSVAPRWNLPHLLAFAQSIRDNKVLPRVAGTTGPFTARAMAFVRAVWPDLARTPTRAVTIPPTIDLHGRMVVDHATLAHYKTAARWAAAMQVYTGAVFLPNLADVTGLPIDVVRAATQALRGVQWYTNTWFSIPQRRISRLAATARHIIALAGRSVPFGTLYTGIERANRRTRVHGRVATLCQPVPPAEIACVALRTNPLFHYDAGADRFDNAVPYDALRDLSGARRALIQAMLDKGGAMGLDDFEQIRLASGGAIGRVNLRMLLTYAPALERKAPGVYAIRGRALPEGLLDSIAIRRPFGADVPERPSAGPFTIEVPDVAKTLHHSQTYLHVAFVPRSAPGPYTLAGTDRRACTLVEDGHGARLQRFSPEFRRALGEAGAVTLAFDDAERTVAVTHNPSQ